MKKTFLLLIISLLPLSGCVTAQFNEQQRSYYDQKLTEISTKPTVLVTDACVFRDAIGEDEDFINIQASRIAAESASNAIAAFLKSNDHQIKKIVYPTLCAGAQLQAREKLATTKKRGNRKRAVTTTSDDIDDEDYSAGDEDPTEPPALQIAQSLDDEPTLVTEVPLAMDPNQREISVENANELFRILNDRMAQFPALRGSTDPIPSHINPALLEQVKATTGVEHIWLLRSGGVDVSAGKAIGMGLLTAVTSVALSGGSYIYSSYASDAYGYALAILDLNNGEFVWLKGRQGIPGNPSNQNIYSEEWAMGIFDPLYKRVSCADDEEEDEYRNEDTICGAAPRRRR